MTVILASASSARRKLLENAGFLVKQQPVDLDESSFSQKNAKSATRILALAKMRLFKKNFPDLLTFPVITADTLISIKGRILGKAASREEASFFLARLSGKKHQVYSSFCLFLPDLHQIYTESVKTEVSFINLNQKMINDYLDSGEWQGAAGAYRIQGRGECLISRINGSYSNVAGLPISRIYYRLMSYN